MIVSAPKSWRSVAAFAVSGIMLVLFVYGCGRFGNGPISECASGYCSTRGYIHSEADFKAYKAWEKTIFIVWPLGLLGLWLLNRGKGDE
jgi:hypothetical protein